MLWCFNDERLFLDNGSIECPQIHDISKMLVEYLNSLEGVQALQCRIVGVDLSVAIRVCLLLLFWYGLIILK